MCLSACVCMSLRVSHISGWIFLHCLWTFAQAWKPTGHCQMLTPVNQSKSQQVDNLQSITNLRSADRIDNDENYQGHYKCFISIMFSFLHQLYFSWFLQFECHIKALSPFLGLSSLPKVYRQFKVDTI